MILDATAASYGFSVEAICGPSRTPPPGHRPPGGHVPRPGADRLQLSRHRPGLRRRDHTTVIHAVDKIAGQMQERRQIYEQVTELIQQIRAGSA